MRLNPSRATGLLAVLAAAVVAVGACAVTVPGSGKQETPGPAGTNVRDFGAVGDGNDDDGPAVARARDAAGVGGRLVFPSGTYRFAGPMALTVPNQEWALATGAVLKIGSRLYLDAPNSRLVGPGGIDETAGRGMGVQIRYNAATPDEAAVVSDVELYGSPTGDCALIYADGDYARVERSFLHDSACVGVMINTDGEKGHRGIELRSNRFVNITLDGIHSKGTNADWKGGVWIPAEQRNVGHKFIGNVMENVAQARDTFSMEIQDGHVDAEIRDNRADQTFSIVGQLRAQVSGNVFAGHGSVWGMEIGYFRDGEVRNNTFQNCHIGIAMTGNTDKLNTGSLFAGNKFENCDMHISIEWDGGGNRYMD